MCKDDFDDIIMKTVKDESAEIDGLNNIDIPSIDDSMKKLINNLQNDIISIPAPQPLKKTMVNNGFLRKFAAVACVLLFSLILSLIYEIPQVNAFKAKVINTLINAKDSIISITHIDKDNNTIPQPGENPGDDAIIQHLSLEQLKTLPFHVLTPGYLSQGYSLNDIESRVYPNKIQVITQTYKSTNNKTIRILQTANIKNVNTTLYVNPDNGGVKTIDINGSEVTILAGDSYNEAIWYKNEMKFNISATVSYNEIILIIEGLI